MFTCPVCTEDIPNKKDIQYNNYECDHAFCKSCATKWDETQFLGGKISSCPVCRSKFTRSYTVLVSFDSFDIEITEEGIVAIPLDCLSATIKASLQEKYECTETKDDIFVDIESRTRDNVAFHLSNILKEALGDIQITVSYVEARGADEKTHCMHGSMTNDVFFCLFYFQAVFHLKNGARMFDQLRHFYTMASSVLASQPTPLTSYNDTMCAYFLQCSRDFICRFNERTPPIVVMHA